MSNEEKVEKRKIIVFDDGSLQFQVLEAEKKKDKSKDLVKIEAGKDLDKSKTLDFAKDYFAKIDKKTMEDEAVRIELHFTLEDYDKFDLDNQLNMIRNENPNVGFIKTYALMSRPKLERLAQKLGIGQSSTKSKKAEAKEAKEAAAASEEKKE